MSADVWPWRTVFLVLAAAVADGLPAPQGVDNNMTAEHLLCMQLCTHQHLRQWAAHLDLDVQAPQPKPDTGHVILSAYAYGWNWHGWTVQLVAYEPVADTSVDPADAVDAIRREAALVVAAALAPDSLPEAFVSNPLLLETLTGGA
jgi:hypothetical protein